MLFSHFLRHYGIDTLMRRERLRHILRQRVFELRYFIIAAGLPLLWACFHTMLRLRYIIDTISEPLRPLATYDITRPRHWLFAHMLRHKMLIDARQLRHYVSPLLSHCHCFADVTVG